MVFIADTFQLFKILNFKIQVQIPDRTS